MSRRVLVLACLGVALFIVTGCASGPSTGGQQEAADRAVSEPTSEEATPATETPTVVATPPPTEKPPTLADCVGETEGFGNYYFETVDGAVFQYEVPYEQTETGTFRDDAEQVRQAAQAPSTFYARAYVDNRKGTSEETIPNLSIVTTNGEQMDLVEAWLLINEWQSALEYDHPLYEVADSLYNTVIAGSTVLPGAQSDTTILAGYGDFGSDDIARLFIYDPDTSKLTQLGQRPLDERDPEICALVQGEVQAAGSGEVPIDEMGSAYDDEALRAEAGIKSNIPPDLLAAAVDAMCFAHRQGASDAGIRDALITQHGLTGDEADGLMSLRSDVCGDQ